MDLRLRSVKLTKRLVVLTHPTTFFAVECIISDSSNKLIENLGEKGDTDLIDASPRSSLMANEQYRNVIIPRSRYV